MAHGLTTRSGGHQEAMTVMGLYTQPMCTCRERLQACEATLMHGQYRNMQPATKSGVGGFHMLAGNGM